MVVVNLLGDSKVRNSCNRLADYRHTPRNERRPGQRSPERLEVQQVIIILLASSRDLGCVYSSCTHPHLLVQCINSTQNPLDTRYAYWMSQSYHGTARGGQPKSRRPSILLLVRLSVIS